MLWTLHNYEKNHLWPFEARADFSVSLTSHVSEPPAGGPGSGGSPPSPDFEDLYVMPLAVGYAPRKSQLISQRASRNGPLFVVLLLIERLHHDPEKAPRSPVSHTPRVESNWPQQAANGRPNRLHPLNITP